MTDMVNHPPHYGQHPSGVECITITEHMNFNIGNAVKYLWRADLKNGLEDLEKAAWYVNREIQRVKALHPLAPVIRDLADLRDLDDTPAVPGSDEAAAEDALWFMDGTERRR